MTTLELMSRLNYLLGRFEGIASALPDSISGVKVDFKNAMLDTCEWLQELIDELGPKETVSAKDVMDGKKAYDTNGCVTTGRSDACVTCDFYDSESDYCTLCRNSVGSCQKKNITLPNTATVSAKPNSNVPVASYNAELTRNSVDPNKPTATITSPFWADEWKELKKEFGIDTMCEVKP